MRLLALFAGIAITLAAIGIYSVLVYSVERRGHEIGIRLALGAKRAHIMGLIVGRGVRLSLAGAVLGVAGGPALTRYLESLLYGVTPHDPATLAAGCALILLTALVAAYVPAGGRSIVTRSRRCGPSSRALTLPRRVADARRNAPGSGTSEAYRHRRLVGRTLRHGPLSVTVPSRAESPAYFPVFLKIPRSIASAIA